MSTKEYISIQANGTVRADATEVIISFYGSRGGKVACVSIPLESAVNLRDQISKAVANIFGREVEPKV